MKFILSKKFLLIFTLILLGFLGVGREVEAVCTANNNVYGWGWNPYVGWISLNCKQTPSSSIEYGVNVSGSNVNGYAWNGWGSGAGEGYWICFGSSCDPDVSTSYSGGIDGWAKFVNWDDGDGLIKLNGVATNGSPYTMNLDFLDSASVYYYTVRMSLTVGGFDSEVGGYSWNDKIGWIRWYSVCGDADGDDYGSPLVGWGLNPSLENDRKVCGNDCDDSNSSIYPGSTEVCDNSLDDDCDGLIDCNDIEDCPSSVTGPSNLTPNDSQCGQINLSWWPGIGTTGATCFSPEDEGANYFKIYRSINQFGCNCLTSHDCEGVSSCREVDSINNDGRETSYTYSDLSVIPRVDYYYWITRVVEADDGEGGTIVVESDPIAAVPNPSMTVCYPGSEWGED